MVSIRKYVVCYLKEHFVGCPNGTAIATAIISITMSTTAIELFVAIDSYFIVCEDNLS